MIFSHFSLANHWCADSDIFDISPEDIPKSTPSEPPIVFEEDKEGMPLLPGLKDVWSRLDLEKYLVTFFEKLWSELQYFQPTMIFSSCFFCCLGKISSSPLPWDDVSSEQTKYVDFARRIECFERPKDMAVGRIFTIYRDLYERQSTYMAFRFSLTPSSDFELNDPDDGEAMRTHGEFIQSLLRCRRLTSISCDR